jgi:hypothetical protein
MIWNWGILIQSLKILGWAGFFGSLFFLHTWQSVEYNRIQREIQRKVKEKDSLIRKNDAIRVSILTQVSAEKIDKLFEKNNLDQENLTKRKIVNLLLPEEAKQKE